MGQTLRGGGGAVLDELARLLAQSQPGLETGARVSSTEPRPSAAASTDVAVQPTDIPKGTPRPTEGPNAAKIAEAGGGGKAGGGGTLTNILLGPGLSFLNQSTPDQNDPNFSTPGGNAALGSDIGKLGGRAPAIESGPGQAAIGAVLSLLAGPLGELFGESAEVASEAADVSTELGDLSELNPSTGAQDFSGQTATPAELNAGLAPQGFIENAIKIGGDVLGTGVDIAQGVNTTLGAVSGVRDDIATLPFKFTSAGIDELVNKAQGFGAGGFEDLTNIEHLFPTSTHLVRTGSDALEAGRLKFGGAEDEFLDIFDRLTEERQEKLEEERRRRSRGSIRR